MCPRTDDESTALGGGFSVGITRALLLGNFQRRQRLQQLLGSHRDGDQALDQVDDRVRAALLAQKIISILSPAQYLDKHQFIWSSKLLGSVF